MLLLTEYRVFYRLKLSTEFWRRVIVIFKSYLQTFLWQLVLLSAYIEFLRVHWHYLLLEILTNGRSKHHQRSQTQVLLHLWKVLQGKWSVLSWVCTLPLVLYPARCYQAEAIFHNPPLLQITRVNPQRVYRCESRLIRSNVSRNALRRFSACAFLNALSEICFSQGRVWCASKIIVNLQWENFTNLRFIQIFNSLAVAALLVHVKIFRFNFIN